MDKMYKLSENTKVLSHENKIIYANKNNGMWIRTNKETYDIINNIIDQKLNLAELEFENLEDKKYILDVLNNLLNCEIIYDSNYIPSGKIHKNRAISIELTNKCNLNCIHCCISAGDSRTIDLSTEDIKDIFRKCVKWDPQTISLSGGEPMLRKDFFELLIYLRSIYSGEIALSTNATFINEENAKILCANLQQIDISIDGVNEETCSIVRGKGVFGHVLNSVELLKKSNFNNISLSMVFADKNEYLESEFLKLNERLGTKPISRTFASVGRGKENKSIFSSLDDNKVYLPDDFLKYKDVQLGIRNCDGGKSSVFIRYNGDIYPCASFIDQKYKIGNILNIKELSDIIDKNNFSYSLEEKMKNNPIKLSKDCYNCIVEPFCWTCPGEIDRMPSKEALDYYCNNCKPILMNKIWGI